MLVTIQASCTDVVANFAPKAYQIAALFLHKQASRLVSLALQFVKRSSVCFVTVL